MANAPTHVTLAVNVRLKEEDLDRMRRMGKTAQGLAEKFQAMGDQMAELAQQLNTMVEDHPTLFTD